MTHRNNSQIRDGRCMLALPRPRLTVAIVVFAQHSEGGDRQTRPRASLRERQSADCNRRAVAHSLSGPQRCPPARRKVSLTASFCRAYNKAEKPNAMVGIQVASPQGGHSECFAAFHLEMCIRRTEAYRSNLNMLIREVVKLLYANGLHVGPTG